ncbi:uncharacterized protein LOC129761954 [Toxorhynchites rutilus septentrionalis]|uniref:uncharacterized protein LOC129761954 n=1 Tax=Toxorhynchites rutilus septentrionalis TaxID=329112 RepID=UPI0024788F67|nr:uncharacterized protein LOC129761954 [Toxorhynchites rutilus septentrionalis]
MEIQSEIVIPSQNDLHHEKQAVLSMNILEAICSTACVGVHLYALVKHPVLYRGEMLFFGVYLGYALLSTFSCLSLCRGNVTLNYVSEAVVSFVGWFGFVVCGFFAVLNVDYNVRNHLSHSHDRLESIFSMLTSGLFLMHGSFMLDVLGVLENMLGTVSVASLRSDDGRARQRLKLKPFWMFDFRGFFKRLLYRAPNTD